MQTSQLLSHIAVALVPRHDEPQRAEPMAHYFLTHLPWHIRFAFSLIVHGVWWLAGIARRGEPTRIDATVAWISTLVHSQTPLAHSLGLWLKATACMIVLADQTERRAVYATHHMALPSTVDSAPPPLAATDPLMGVQVAPAALRAEQTVDDADFIVVGSGPGGATVARALAAEGRSVIILEEGSPVPRAWRADSTLHNLVERFRFSGTMTTTGPENMPVLQGVGVGGSSVVNSAIVWRAPDDVFAGWHAWDPGLAEHITLDRMAAAYDTVERAIGVQRTAASILGPNSDLMAHAARSLSIDAAPTRRYTTSHCEGLGRCMEGCPRGHKLSMNTTFIPDALHAGARLYAHCRVDRVAFDGGRAVGVHATMHGKHVRFAARHGVVIAASAIQTPLLLRASGIRHAQIGQRFQAHPGASVAAIFDSPVRAGKFGATQGYDSIHFRNQGRFKLESLNLPDELLATRLPGVGKALARHMDVLPYTALWAAQVRTQAHGRVFGRQRLPLITFHFTPEDQRVLGRSLKTLADMFFAAGAKEVLPGILGAPDRVTDPKQLDHLLDGVHPRQVAMILSHLFGTAVMGADPQRSVCDPYGRVHQVEGLYVADSSLFPTNMGVNPQHTIMAVAQHVAWGVLEQRKRLAA